MLKEKKGCFSLVLERPFSPFPIQELLLMNDLDILFNRGRVPVATWSKTLVASAVMGSCSNNGNSGFVVFSPKFLQSKAWKILNNENGNTHPLVQLNTYPAPLSQLICISMEEDSSDAEWTHGSFPLGEYTKAIDRSKGEIYYNHSLGMQYSKVCCSTTFFGVIVSFSSPSLSLSLLLCSIICSLYMIFACTSS